MTDAVSFFRALSDDTRWRIVRLVMERALCVCELADVLEMPQSSVSSHVQIIRRAGLLESETCGKWTYFRIAAARLPLIKTLVRQLSSAEEFSKDLDRANTRLARREASCCPGPVKLAKPRNSTTH